MKNQKGEVDPMKVIIGAIIIIATLIVLFMIITGNYEKMTNLWKGAFG